MPPKSKRMCSVPGCHNYGDKINKIALHQFPKNSSLRKQWHHVTLIPKPITKNYFVCSSHFTSDDYKSETHKHYLKSTAVPSKNLPIRKFPKPPPKQRSLRLQEVESVVETDEMYFVPVPEDMVVFNLEDPDEVDPLLIVDDILEKQSVDADS